MIVIPPIDCTAPGVLTATNAVDLAAYSAAATYAADAQISYNKRNWISVQAGNVGHTPGTDALWWVDNGPINSLAMFDTSVQTATTRTGGLSWTLSVGRFTAIGLMGLVGQSVTLTITDGAATIYAETRTLSSSAGTYYSFAFEDLNQTDSTTFTGLPSSPTCQVQISVASSGLAACSMCVIGKQVFIGHAQYGFQNPIEDRGRHYLDALANPVNVERGYSKGASGTVMVDRASYNRLVYFLAAHIGMPMLWSAAPEQEDLVGADVFGRYVRAVPVIDNPAQITLAIDIAGYR